MYLQNRKTLKRLVYANQLSTFNQQSRLRELIQRAGSENRFRKLTQEHTHSDT